MLIGPIMLLVVAPALRSVFLTGYAHPEEMTSKDEDDDD
jgi:hypothetical protein